MKTFRPLFSILLLAGVLLPAASCRQTAGFTDDYTIRDVLDAAAAEIPGVASYPVNGAEVLKIINTARKDPAQFTPATIVSLFDNDGGSYLLYVSKDRRHFELNGTGYSLSRKQARVLDKYI